MAESKILEIWETMQVQQDPSGNLASLGMIDRSNLHWLLDLLLLLAQACSSGLTLELTL